MSDNEIFFYNMKVKILEKKGCKTVFSSDSNENGKMTSFSLFPGITLIYNDFKTSICSENKEVFSGIMEINHCRKGRFECELSRSTYAYLGEGEISVNMLNIPTSCPKFPLGYYSGISFLIDTRIAGNSVSNILKDVHIDFYKIQDKLCPDNICMIAKAPAKMGRLFNELYELNTAFCDDVNEAYLRIKSIEFLFLLNHFSNSEILHTSPYFSADMVNKVKAVKNKLTVSLEKEFTIKELSEEFDISATGLKNCFKAVYGKTIYSFRREYRIVEAAKMLNKTSISISEISGLVGYENPSKFSAAFKEVMGVNPSNYRKI